MVVRRLRQDWNGEVPEITHGQLVNRAFDYLRMVAGCKVVFKERVASERETPDAIGFIATASMLIECKASRADFLSDKKKSFRRRPQDGMGYKRYYMAPVGLLEPSEMPEGWGLLEVYEKDKRGRRKVDESRGSEEFFERNQGAELGYLVSAIRRIQISMAVFVESAN